MCEDCIPKQMALVKMVINRLKEDDITKEDVIMGLELLTCQLSLQQIVEPHISKITAAPPLDLVPSE